MSLPTRPVSRQFSGVRQQYVSAARRRLVRAAAFAAAFALLLALVVLGITYAFRPAPPSVYPDVATASSAPPYYVTVDPNDRIVVYATATGRLTAMTAQPAMNGGYKETVAIAAATSGRVFLAAFYDQNSLRTYLFRFGLTSSGHIIGLTRIHARLPGLTDISIGLSPDGSHAVVAGLWNESREIDTQTGPPELVLVNLATARYRVVWRGQSRAAENWLIQNPSWTANGRAVNFLIARCDGGRFFPANAVCTGPGPFGQEWTLPIRPSSKVLPGARLLAKLPGVTVQAVNGPSPGTLTVMRLENRHASISVYDMRSGRESPLLFGERAGPGLWYVNLSTDPSGRYVLLDQGIGSEFGWLQDGGLQQLSDKEPFGIHWTEAAAW